MNSVERVKMILKERGIAVSKLEKDLGFSNGYIAQLRKGMFPADRLEKIAEYLNVSTDILLYGDSEQQKTAVPQVEDDGMLEMLEAIRDNYALRMLFEEAVKLPKSKILETLAIIEKNKETEIDY